MRPPAAVPEWHLVTGEYPPQVGGVSDYAFGVAGGLAAAGDPVHVWCPAADGETPAQPGVAVHRELGRATSADLARVDAALLRHPAPRRFLVQWVPHSYGRRSLNLPFCLWLLRRARRHGDEVDLVVHEPWLAFARGSWRQSAAAAVHRLMTIVLLRAAARVWVVAAETERLWRPYALGRSVLFGWVPLPNGVPVVEDPAAAARVRATHAPDGAPLLGHFGTYGPWVAGLLLEQLPAVLAASGGARALLVGRGSEAFRDRLLSLHPVLAGRVHATGLLPAAAVSTHLAACDVLLQPYPDGVSARRSSLIAGLAHGVPTVTNEGRASEPLWRESGAVLLVPVGDAGAAARAVGRLLADPVARGALGERGRRLYEERFTLSRTVQRLRSRDAGSPAARGQDLPARAP